MLFSSLALKTSQNIFHRISRLPLLIARNFQGRKFQFKKLCLKSKYQLALYKSTLSVTLCQTKIMELPLGSHLRILKSFLKFKYGLSINARFKGFKMVQLCRLTSMNRCSKFSELVYKTKSQINMRSSPQLVVLIAGCCFSKQNEDYENTSLISEKASTYNSVAGNGKIISKSSNYENPKNCCQSHPTTTISSDDGSLEEGMNVVPTSSNEKKSTFVKLSDNISCDENSNKNCIIKLVEDSAYVVHSDDELRTPYDSECKDRVSLKHFEEGALSKPTKRPAQELSTIKKLKTWKDNTACLEPLPEEPLICVKNEHISSVTKIPDTKTVSDLKTIDLCKSNGSDDHIYNISSLFHGEKYVNRKSKNNVHREEESDEKPNKRPNYFVSLRVSNPEIHKSLEEVQNYIIDQDERLKPSMISLSTLHITLMVFHLSSDEEFVRATEILNNAHQFLNESMSSNPLKLEFEGLGNFRNNVLFAKVKAGDSLNRLIKMSQDVNKWFEDASIFSTDKRKEFNSHLTVMKLGRFPQLYRKGIKKINPSLYSAYKDHAFGVEVIRSIELLKMCGPKDASGYYSGVHFPFDVPSEVNIINPPVEKPLPSEMLAKEIQEAKSKISALMQTQMKEVLSREKGSNVSAKHESASESEKKDIE